MSDYKIDCLYKPSVGYKLGIVIKFDLSKILVFLVVLFWYRIHHLKTDDVLAPFV